MNASEREKAPLDGRGLFMKRIVNHRTLVSAAIFLVAAMVAPGAAAWTTSQLAADQDSIRQSPAEAVSTNETSAAQQRRRGFGRFGGRMEGLYKAQVTPHWFAKNTRFWYQNELRGGGKEFILVDAEQGTRQPAFDHQKLAPALAKALGEDVKADRLPVSELEFSEDGKTMKFSASGKKWNCHLDTETISVSPESSDNGSGTDAREGKVEARAARPGQTGSAASSQESDEDATNRRGRGRGRSTRSPDGKWNAFVRDNNVFVRAQPESPDQEPIQLSQDGQEDNAYGRLEWSADSKELVAWRIEPGERKDVYLIRSSPSGGGRAQLETRPYAQAGDRFTHYQLNVFDVGVHKQGKPEVEPIEHEWIGPTLHWSRDGQRFSFLRVDRGHQRLRVIEVDAQSGAARNLIDEKSDTFIWTVHTENLRLELVNWLEKTDEIIYVSEQDGWRHLYLVDPKDAKLRQITKGEWVLRGIEKIDEDARQIWFSAGGKNPDQDPYFLQYYRVNFDGSGLVALTDGNGNHSIQFSPDRKYIVDTWSRVDMAPVNELRRTSDGKLVCKLEEADITELKEKGFQPPEILVAKGRDGKTDIWGLIHRPHKFDPNKKYPVIESIYAGPQGSFVPKAFGGSGRFSSLTDLGFIVVQIDGMGTANRSKAFHDVCFHNLKDGGFADRILWMKAAGARHPEMDITRVGVYGNSAGGQNAAAAVLFHPDFYKAAVASCGCHDNRLDKASWNEQWMGYMPPDKLWSKDPDNWYSQCSNIDNAWRLKGKLFLIVGETDHNVPPESTLRLADALIKANKDFDLLVIPGGDHGMGGAYGDRRMRDFFVRNLLSTEPPNRNASNETGAGG
jgi:dipeptidyl aminopeptidase/acylaminoacyl peptidase